MLWRMYTLGHAAYVGLSGWDSPTEYVMNVVIRPATMVCLFGFVSTTVGTDAEQRRVVIGAALLALNWIVIAGPMYTVGGELANGTLGINFASPVRRAELLASRALPHVPSGLLSVVCTVIIGYLVFRIDLSQANVAAALCAVPLIVLSFTALGLVCGIGSLALREMNGFVGVSGLYVYLLSGGIVPVESFPQPIEGFTAIVPGRWGIAALREAIEGGGLASVWLELVREVGVGAGYFLAALAGITWYEWRARATGSADMV